MFEYKFVDDQKLTFPHGKVVCVGRNYLEHIQELNNVVPDEPVLFIKPFTSLVNLENPIKLPKHGNSCHHEIEIAVLIGEKIYETSMSEVEKAILGYALGLDLTLRDVQSGLKSKGLPWELAKAFDGSCPVSPFIRKEEVSDLQEISFSLKVNGETRQQGYTKMMMRGIVELVSIITKYFTLLPGDIVLTGTPTGVKELKPQDKLILNFNNQYKFYTSVL